MTISNGQILEITDPSQCTGKTTLLVESGTVNVRVNCALSSYVSIEPDGRLEVFSGATLKVPTLAVSLRSISVFRGAIEVNTFSVRYGADVTMVLGSSFRGLEYLTISEGGKLTTDSYIIPRLKKLTMYDGTLTCRGNCQLTADSVEIHISRILASGVSTVHQSCGQSNVATSGTGGSYAGCGGELNCCPFGSLLPHGQYKTPGNIGVKGGTCGDDGAGLGGGSWELTFTSVTTINGTNYIQANGGSPNPARGGNRGGGSGGSILLRMPCSQANMNLLRLEANGGNALSATNYPAYGGSAGRIAIHCTGGVYNIDEFPRIFSAYGGKNVNAPGWGATGTIYLSIQNEVQKRRNRIYVIDNADYYAGSPVPYYPATFLLFVPYETYEPEVDLWLESRSDIILFAYSQIPTSIKMNVVGTSSGELGAVVNAIPDNLGLTLVGIDGRPSFPKVPPNAGSCSTFYIGE